MFCNNCGKQVPDGSNFCSACGSRLNPTEAPEIEKIETPVENIDYEPDTHREPIRKPMVSFDWSEVKDEPHKKPAVNVVSPWGNTGLEVETQPAPDLFVEPEPTEQEYSRTMSFIDILKKEREEKEKAAEEATLNMTEREDEQADYTAFNEAPQYYMPPLYENLEAELSAILDEGAATPAYEEEASEKVDIGSITAELAQEFYDDAEFEDNSISTLESMLGKIKEETPDATSEPSDEPTLEAVETFDAAVEGTGFVDYEALMAELTGVDAESEDTYEAEPVAEAVAEPEPTLQTEAVVENADVTDDTLFIDEIVDLYSTEEPEAQESLFSSVFEPANESVIEPATQFEAEPVTEPVMQSETESVANPILEPVAEETPAQEIDARDAEIEELKRRLAELMGTSVAAEETADNSIDNIADLASAMHSETPAQEETEPELAADDVFTTLPSWDEVETEPAAELTFEPVEVAEVVEPAATEEAFETVAPEEPAVTEEAVETILSDEPVVTVEPVELEDTEAEEEQEAEPEAASILGSDEGTYIVSDVDDVDDEDDEDEDEDDDDLPLIDPTPLDEEQLSLVEDHEAKPAEEADSSETDAMSVEELERDLFGTVTEAEVEAEVTKKIDKFYTLYKKNEEFQRLLDEEYNKLKNEEEVVPTVSGVLEEASKAATAAEAQPEEKAAEVTVTKDTGVVSVEPEDAADAPIVEAEPATKAEVVDDAEESGKGGTALTVIAVVVAVLLVILLAIILVLNFAPDSGIAIKIDSIIETITSYFSAVDATGNLLL